MNLIIDIGNTRVKAAVFENNQLKEFFVFKTQEELLNAPLFSIYSITHCILGTVVNEIDAFVKALKTRTDVLLFTSETPTPIKNLYKTAHSLGSDRLAAAVGGNFLFPNKNILIIDAGTCIKYNLVTAQNEYIGGAISPGLNMRFKALHTFTSRLPLLELDENSNVLVGTTSNESILSGIQNGAVAEVQGFIQAYKEMYDDITVVISGGDVNFFEKRLKKPIFADSFLILKGLNAILEYNLKVK
ncbi:MAG TPA: type III pantothenate kinase [Bacteroidia bacterium]|jgi:type III pantothenate kinase|nr:type III pantothenate kinase [Bacteroidia bacterium]